MAFKPANAQSAWDRLTVAHTFEHLLGLPAEVSKTAFFEAAHHLHVCEDGRMYKRLHGHSFQVTVTLRAVPGAETGWVEDMATLGEALETIRAELDHAYLNEIEGLETSTLERLCAWIGARLSLRFPESLHAVDVARPSLNERCRLVIPQTL